MGNVNWESFIEIFEDTNTNFDEKKVELQIQKLVREIFGKNIHMNF